jgi:alpha-tubulin suppressor-like RCC1 family protein
MSTLSRLAISGAAISLGAFTLLSCTETTAPARRYAVLDDEGGSDWQTVSVGGDHSCALKTNGNAYCWGSNAYGQLGVARFDTTCGSGNSQYRCAITPQQVQPGVKFASISTGERHTCAITTTREAYCWGANDQNQLGQPAFSGPTLLKVPGSLPWAQISAGSSHTCAVRTDGALFCWGSNDRGQLGNADFSSGFSPVRVGLPAPVASVSAGEHRTCARTTNGTVYCWGAVWTSRDKGLEITRTQSTPQVVPGAPSMAWISVGTFTTCGSDASGFAYCWEGNPRGEMGTGNQTGSTTPQRVATDLEFVQLSAGIVQSCGVVISGIGYCWGDDSFGQIGVSPSVLVERCDSQQLPCTTTPVRVTGRQQFTEISTGFGSHTCGVTIKGNLYCWGLGVSGQRGDGIKVAATSLPTLVVEPIAR